VHISFMQQILVITFPQQTFDKFLSSDANNAPPHATTSFTNILTKHSLSTNNSRLLSTNITTMSLIFIKPWLLFTNITSILFISVSVYVHHKLYLGEIWPSFYKHHSNTLYLQRISLAGFGRLQSENFSGLY